MSLLHFTFLSPSNQPEILELLIKKGANINATNSGQCSALHVAINKQHLKCVRLLLKYKCDVNIQVLYSMTRKLLVGTSIAQWYSDPNIMISQESPVCKNLLGSGQQVK